MNRQVNVVSALHCLNCDKILTGVAKKYCDTSCQIQFQNDRKVSDWLNGWNPTNYEVPEPIRRHMLATANNKCTSPTCCVSGGWAEKNPKTGRSPLTIDHIDGNAENNLKDNLRVLCPNCHSLTPTYGGLNRGNGRSKRYKPA